MKFVWGIVVTLLTATITMALLFASLSFVLAGVPWLAVIIPGVAMAIYGIVAAAVGSYDLSSGGGWLALLVDCTWSLPNTLFGAALGLPVYALFGAPSTSQSQGQNWVSYAPRSSTGFGNNVLQTLGTVNLGGAGQHERMHLLQARIFGPLYLPLFAVFYIATSLIQILFTLILGLALKAANLRSSACLRPPADSAVSGFFGWIYYATPFEVWAYASGNP